MGWGCISASISELMEAVGHVHFHQFVESVEATLWVAWLDVLQLRLGFAA